MSSHFKPVLSGFEHVKRFWDGKRHKVVAKVLPGEFYVSKSDELITTVLGSCIAACIYDEGLGIGGMNHFMLPAEKGVDPSNAHSLNCRYGNWAMEYLINEILKNGGSTNCLSSIVQSLGQIVSSRIEPLDSSAIVIE